METTIGGKRFPAFGFGRLGKEAEKETKVRWTSYVETVNLTALTGTATATGLLVINSLNDKVMLKSITVRAIFQDSGAGAYNVSEGVIIVPLDPLNNDANILMSLPNNYNVNDLNLLCRRNQNGFLEINASITGGTVNRISGITPGAGDTVLFTILSAYYV